MNLLIVDPFMPQSYYILWGLKKYCKRIVVANPKKGLLPRIFSYTANSRYVSKLYSVQDPLENWEEAVFSPGNSKSVEGFIKDVLFICKKEKIDLIYPTDDFTVYILSKNQERFAQLGVKIPVLPITLLRQVVDKYKIIELAKSNNITCPKTILISDIADLDRGISQLGLPLILKRRFSSGSRGIRFIDEDNRGSIKSSLGGNIQNNYILQEFIPGKEMVYVRIYMDRAHRPAVESYVRSKRPELRIFQGKGISEETILPPEIVDKVKEFFAHLRYVGYGHVQFKTDARDNTLKLLELNPRISQGTWAEMSLGFNAPFVNYNLFYGEDPGFSVYHRPTGIFFLYPIEDGIIMIKYLIYLLKKNIYRARKFLLGKKNPLEKLPLLSELILDYLRRHILLRPSQRKYNLFLKNIIKDPLVSISYWLAYSYIICKKEYPHEF